MKEDLNHLLHRASQRADAATKRALRKANLTPRQYLVLTILREHGKMRQADIVKKSGIDRSTLADMLNRMGKRGLTISARCKADERVNLICITPEGIAVSKSSDDAVSEAMARLAKTMPPGTLQGLTAGLNHIANQP